MQGTDANRESRLMKDTEEHYVTNVGSLNKQRDLLAAVVYKIVEMEQEEPGRKPCQGLLCPYPELEGGWAQSLKQGLVEKE